LSGLELKEQFHRILDVDVLRHIQIQTNTSFVSMSIVILGFPMRVVP